MESTLIKNATLVNEGQITVADVLIEGERIVKIGTQLSAGNARVIDAEGHYLLPGIIDDQVHFRDPGLTHKGDLESESRAAIAGGITSYIDQPNTVPHAVTQELLAQKYQNALGRSYANYSFMMGGTNDNLAEILKTNPRDVAGLKLFLGSSTGDMLVDSSAAIEAIFVATPLLIAVHCEDETTVKTNLAHYKEQFGEDIPVHYHPLIRTEEACYLSSSKTVALAKKTGARLHVFHISTAKELDLFDNTLPLEEKKITAEVCIHHLWFSDADYATRGSLIKWNPAVKTAADREALWEALNDGRIDVVATDHAPHTLEEKSQVYTKAPSGGPLVQHALIAMLEAVQEGKISLEKVVEKMAHNPAVLFKIEDRGFIREGYYADLVLVNPKASWTVTKENVLYKCGWSPMEGTTFHHQVTHTFVNGTLAYEKGTVHPIPAGKRLLFNR
ncbi:MAG: dihydroorotase [Flavobacterium sp.]|jgi:dihydroorotase|uniref:dihydroorotase n=1 Tax=Flavobacterium sp. TaxID=239 RepID=UPI0022BE8E65|nr:dihydroorotase [Flavobacterium sp.]MCZ8168573.1 dihydroorotase [Flavobacterium sp.]MCZ8297311.1 dihydroorotase [Flavobacterium sp.]